jgi:hypothetical integral membrane protein (TIGR02206 family)
MIDNFQMFGTEHILSILLSVVIGASFIYLAHKNPGKRAVIGLLFALTIVAVRSVRYIFDMQLGTFSPLDLLSLHVCHIDLILLVICLIKPNRPLFTFTFLIGIPAALAVALLPGTTHPEPGMARAVFFIMSHTLLAMGAIYLASVYKFAITKKDLLLYYLVSIGGMIAVYIFNLFSGSNFMYLMQGPKNTVLETMYDNLGPLMYVVAIYMILVSLITVLFVTYKIFNKLRKPTF